LAEFLFGRNFPLLDQARQQENFDVLGQLGRKVRENLVVVDLEVVRPADYIEFEDALSQLIRQFVLFSPIFDHYFRLSVRGEVFLEVAQLLGSFEEEHGDDDAANHEAEDGDDGFGGSPRDNLAIRDLGDDLEAVVKDHCVLVEGWQVK
jgi:hypothetical protein